MTFNTNGTTLAITSDANTQAATQYVLPSNQVSLATFDFAETANIEPVKITQLTVTNNAATGVKPGYGNLTLYSGSTPLGTASAAAVGTTNTTTGSAATPASTTITILTPAATGVSTSTGPGIVYLTVGNLQPLAINLPNAIYGSSTLAAALVAAINANPYLTVQATASSTAGAASSTVILTASGTLATSANAGNGTTFSIFATNASTTFAAVPNMSGGASSTLVTTATSTGVYGYQFNFATPVIVPQNNSVALTLRGDLPTFTAGAATDNSTSSF